MYQMLISTIELYCSCIMDIQFNGIFIEMMLGVEQLVIVVNYYKLIFLNYT